MSETVGKALQQTGGEEASETAKFILVMDRFFDCLNVKSLSESYKHLKLYRKPYRSGNDFRLKVYKTLSTHSNLLVSFSG